MKKFIPYIILIILFVWHTVLYAQQRFPRPEFEKGYTYPTNQLLNQRGPNWEYFDVAVLLGALTVTTWLALKKRSRQGLIWMSVFSLAYFGFYRQGCICSIGSVQNVSLALFNNSYSIPLSALLFFMIPLLFALAFGRIFCAGVCPLGAIQELTGLRPVKLPKTVEVMLASVPFVYLSLAVVSASTNSQFLICRYDPFIGIFRLDAPYTMIVFGVLLLLSGIFVNRPYCRFLCPYGVILNVFSRFAGKHLTITPAECTNCRLCEEACPYDAILPSDSEQSREDTDKSRIRFILYLILVPVFTISSAYIFYCLAPALAGVNNNVILAKEIRKEKESGIESVSKAVVAFNESGKTEKELFAEEEQIITRFRKASPWAGSFLGLSLGIAMVSLTIRSKRIEYKPDQGKCVSCGRCFKYCPVKVQTQNEAKPY
ncbi:MAG: 4Fe-4S binding protein [Bacteroidetes bacterium]|nr:MAG: 4Fe-4S binding protein [Bacteroidota bacterium]